MSKVSQRRYRKHIELQYVYVASPEGEAAIAEVFDDIFRRIIKKMRDKKISESEAKC